MKINELRTTESSWQRAARRKLVLIFLLRDKFGFLMHTIKNLGSFMKNNLA